MSPLRVFVAAAFLAPACPLTAQQPVLTIYLRNISIPDLTTLTTAKRVVSQLYGPAGVDVRWKVGAPSIADGPNTLQIEFLESAPPRFATNAMAYATPYRSTGTCIHVFYNRVLHMCTRQFAPVLLGNVMAHEIGHVLEGVARHSDGGVMKAFWDQCDYDSMADAALSFAPEDVSLIRNHWSSQSR